MSDSATIFDHNGSLNIPYESCAKNHIRLPSFKKYLNYISNIYSNDRF